MTLRRRPELVLFDLDGTLVDTAPDLAWSIDASLARLGLPACGEKKVRAWIGSGIEGLLHRALTNDIRGRADAQLFDRAMAVFHGIYYDNISERSRIYPGTRESLARLAEQDIAIACVTNKAARYTEKLLRETGLHDHFGIIVSGDTLAEKKPHPQPIQHAAAHFSVTVDRSWMVGDSLTDVRAARAAGCPVLCVPYGYNMDRDVSELEPDAVINSLADIPSMIEQLQ